MKKILLSVFVVTTIISSLTSCAKEEIKPKAGGNGTALQDKI